MSASGSSSHASERDDTPPHVPPAIGVHGLRMEFGPLTALDGVDLEVGRGEVRGIIGENGAGKSTLMKVISGLYTPTAGQVLVDGRPVELRGPKDAMDRGIVMIHQELNLVDELTVADNIFLGREPRRMGLVDRARIEQESRRLMESFHCRIDPRTRVRELSIAQMQMVEIAKALACDARVLIMDEPTAVLTADETEVLFGLIQGLKARGVTTLYISHMLGEVLRICDRITVMRDGRVINTVAAARSTDHELACMMVGRELSDMFPPMSRARDELVLEVQGLTLHDGAAADVSFQVRAGEIVGFAGLVGAGRTEVGEALVGLRRVTGGTIKLRGRPVRPRGPREASRLGIAYLSEDRRGRGLTTAMGIAENVTMVSLREYCRPLIDRGAEERSTAVHAERLRIKMSAARAPVATLSGGNQQKVAIAKWLETSPEVLILDEPTRGVDVGAKREIYQLIAELAAQGKACIVISSELPEVLGLSHRIVVMREGRVAGILDRADATEERVMYHAAGVAHAGAG